MLRLDGEDMVAEVVEKLAYSPGLQDSGNLEAATRSVTATSKQGSADYDASLTIQAPSDGRLAVQRLALRLAVTIDSFGGGATTLYYSVAVNGSERLTGSWNATGGRLAAVDLPSGQFNLGTANTIAVFLWVNGGNAVVSLCQTWLAVGTASAGIARNVLRIDHSGFLSAPLAVRLLGTGPPTAALTLQSSDINAGNLADATGAINFKPGTVLIQPAVYLVMLGTVSTDLNYVESAYPVLRSER